MPDHRPLYALSAHESRADSGHAKTRVLFAGYFRDAQRPCSCYNCRSAIELLSRKSTILNISIMVENSSQLRPQSGRAKDSLKETLST